MGGIRQNSPSTRLPSGAFCRVGFNSATNVRSDSTIMKITRTLSVVGLACVLAVVAGCISNGNESLRQETEMSVKQRLVEGKTTKAEVKLLFGSPLKTSFTDGGLEVFTYELTNLKANPINFVPLINILGTTVSGTRKELVILFDEKDVVKRFSMSESPVQTKTGVYNN